MKLKWQNRSQLPALAVLASLALVVNMVGYAAANPYYFNGEVSPDPQTYPPIITIASPNNNTACNTSRVPLTFNVAAPYSTTASSTTVIRVIYETDWQKEAISVLHESQEQPSFNLQLSNIPEGQHKILIKAVGYAFYLNEKELSYKEARISSTAVIIFTMDRTAPSVLALPPENISTTSPIPLNLTVNEAHSKIAYSLNGQQNVTITGNTTLPQLTVGQYNLTYYVWDYAGNIGSYETSFNVISKEPEQTFPTLLVETTSIGLIALTAIVGFMVYHKRWRREAS